MQDGRKAVWSIPYVSVTFFPSLKQNFIAYRSSKMSDCIFEIHQLWQSGFSRVYSNCCCSWSFEPEIIRISRSSYKMYSNNILNFQESTTILNAHKSGNLLKAPRIRRDSDYLLKFPFLSHIHVFSCEMSLVTSLKKSIELFFFPFLISDNFRSVTPRDVSIVSGGCNQSSFALFYVAFESLNRCVYTVFNAG